MLWSSPKQLVYNAARKLASKGWITMEKSQEDGRIQLISLTDSGKKQAGPIVAEFARREAAVFEEFGEENCRQLTGRMRQLTEAADRLMEEDR